MELWCIRNPKGELEEEWVWNTKEECEKMMSQLCLAFGPTLDKIPGYRAEPFQVSDLCRADNYQQTTFIVLVEKDGEVRPLIMGNWQTVHKLCNLPLTADIETVTKGTHKMMPMSYFIEHYKVVKTDGGE